MYDMFKNETIRGIHISRYIASWTNVGGGLCRHNGDLGRFEEWLESLVIDDEHLTADEIERIENYAENGKMELEHSAEKFMSK